MRKVITSRRNRVTRASCQSRLTKTQRYKSLNGRLSKIASTTSEMSIRDRGGGERGCRSDNEIIIGYMVASKKWRIKLKARTGADEVGWENERVWTRLIVFTDMD